MVNGGISFHLIENYYRSNRDSDLFPWPAYELRQENPVPLMRVDDGKLVKYLMINTISGLRFKLTWVH